MLARLKELASSQPTAIALANEKNAMSVHDLWQMSEAACEFFAQRSAPLVVYIALPSGPEFAALQIGIVESGCIAVPIPNKLTTSEAARYFDVIRPDWLCVPSLSESQPILAALTESQNIISLSDPTSTHGNLSVIEWRDMVGRRSRLGPTSERVRPPDGTSMVQFTSGSTGEPKAILLEKKHLLANRTMSAGHMSCYENRAVFTPVPQFHAMGNALVLEHLMAGSSIYCANSQMFGNHLRAIVESKAVAVQASPNYFRNMLRMESFGPASLPELRFATIGSDWIDAQLLVALTDRFPEIEVLCRYGLSEAYGALAYRRFGGSAPVSAEGALGEFFPGVVLSPDVARLENDDGPVPLRLVSTTSATHRWMQSGCIMSLLDQEGFIATGDTVRRDAAGRLILSGRESQFIKFNGYRISPYEIEEVLRLASGVDEAAVVGVPDSQTGQRLVACITTDGDSRIDEDHLRNHCRIHLSAYKIPQLFLFGFDVPKTQAGKVSRARLASQVFETLQSIDSKKNPVTITASKSNLNT